MGTEQGKAERVYSFAEREMVMFHGHPIIAVRLDDGRIAVTIQSLAAGMSLNAQAQIRRAERTEALSGEIAYPWLETDSGPQEMPSLILEVLPGWLMGIDTRRVKGEAHDTILAYQREAYGVLYQHFATRPHPALPAAGALAVASPSADPQQVALLAEQIGELTGVVNLLREHLAGLLALPGQVDQLSQQVGQALTLIASLAERQDTTETQVAQIDERTQRLTPAHARTVQEMVDRMVRDTRRLPVPQQLTYATIYGRLKHRFRVGSYREIGDERFDELVAYLRDELRRATSGEAPEQGSLF